MVQMVPEARMFPVTVTEAVEMIPTLSSLPADTSIFPVDDMISPEIVAFVLVMVADEERPVAVTTAVEIKPERHIEYGVHTRGEVRSKTETHAHTTKLPS